MDYFAALAMTDLDFYRGSLSNMGMNLGTPTLQHADVLLAGHGAGVMGVDHPSSTPNDASY
jgi:hypothetical protein